MLVPRDYPSRAEGRKNRQVNVARSGRNPLDREEIVGPHLGPANLARDLAALPRPRSSTRRFQSLV